MCSIAASIMPLRLGVILYRGTNKKKLVAFEKCMAFFLYFGAGVLLCTVFMHLLPDLRETSEIIYKRRILPKISLSYPELTICLGFFFIYTVEQVLHSYITQKSRQRSITLPSKVDGQLELSNGTTNPSITSNLKKEKLNLDIAYVHCEQERIHNKLCQNRNYHSCQTCNNCVPAVDLQRQQADQQFCDSGSVCELTENQELIRSGATSSLLTVLALSTHEVFEGMAVGLETKARMVWYLLAAISCHKTVLAAFIGLQLFSIRASQATSYIFIAVYALTSSLGILIGMVVCLNSTQTDSAVVLLSTIFLQGIATGTLLYVIFFEIYTNHLSTYKLSGIWKSVSSICGFCFTALLQLLLSEPTT